MQASVLVLNANFEPINICDTFRAVGLIQSEKASMVMNGRGYIRTVNRQFPLPSVIRLEKMVSRPRPHLKLTRKEVFRRDGFTCQYCGRKAGDLTIDHVVPRHMGGAHIWTNVVAACPQCNHRKGGRRLDEAVMHILHSPKEPPTSIYYIFSRHLNENSEWEEYLHGW